MPERLRGGGSLLVGLPTLDNGRRFAAPLLAAILAVGYLGYAQVQVAFAQPTDTEENPIIYLDRDCTDEPFGDEISVHGRNFSLDADVIVYAEIFTEGWEPIHSVESSTSDFGTFDVTGLALEGDDPIYRIRATYSNDPDGSVAIAFAYRPCRAQANAWGPETPQDPQGTLGCAPVGATDILVSGTGWREELGGNHRIEITLYSIEPADPGKGGAIIAPSMPTWDEVIETTEPLAAGEYFVLVSEESVPEPFDPISVRVPFVVPCPQVVSVDPDCSAAGFPDDRMDITVAIADFLTPIEHSLATDLQIIFDPDGEPQEFRLLGSDDDGFLDDEYVISPYMRPDGEYRIVVQQGYDADGATNQVLVAAETTFTVPCGVQPPPPPDPAIGDPILYVTPDCFPGTGSITLQVHGRNFEPNRTVFVSDPASTSFAETTTSAFGAFTVNLGTSHSAIPVHQIRAGYEFLAADGIASVHVGDCQPTVTAAPTCGGPSTDHIRIVGSGWSADSEDPNLTVMVGGPLGPAERSIDRTESFDVVLDFYLLYGHEGPAPEGLYSIEVQQSAYDGPQRYAITFFSVPCPTVTVAPTCAPAGEPPTTMSLEITTSDFNPLIEWNTLEIVFDAPGTADAEWEHDPQEWHFEVLNDEANGTFTITPFARPDGVYRIVAKQGYSRGSVDGGGWTHQVLVEGEVGFTVPCEVVDARVELLYATPDCLADFGSVTVDIHGRNFEPNREVEIMHWQTEATRVVTTSAFGTFDVDFTFDHDHNWHQFVAAYRDDIEEEVAFVVLTPCGPQITVDPKCGSALTSVDVVGTGFPADDFDEAGLTIDIQIFNLDLDEPPVGTATVDPATAEFTQRVTFDDFPGGLPDGRYGVLAHLRVFGDPVGDPALTFFLAPCPTLTIQPVCSPAGAPPDQMSIIVTASGFLEPGFLIPPELNRLEIVFSPDNEPQEFWTASPNGSFTIGPFARGNGTYSVLAKQGYFPGEVVFYTFNQAAKGAETHRMFTEASAEFRVPCPGPQPTTQGPLLYTTPDCLSDGGEVTVQLHGRNFDRNRDIEIWDFATESFAEATTSDFGTFDIEFTFPHDGQHHQIVAFYADEPESEPVAYVILSDCRARIAVDPKCGEALTSVEVSGSGFRSSEQPIVILIRDLDTLDVVAEATTFGEPTFEVTITFDDVEMFPDGFLPEGQYLVVATQGTPFTEGSFVADFRRAVTYLTSPCPTITLEPVCGPLGAPPDTLTLNVTASGFIEHPEVLERLEIVFDPFGEPQEFITDLSNGEFIIEPFRRGAGVYTVLAKQGYERGEIVQDGTFFFVIPGETNRVWTEATVDFRIPCLEPVITIDVSCGQQAVVGADATYAITVSGTGYLPVALVNIYFDFEMVSGVADVFEVVAGEEGEFDAEIDPLHRPPGEYLIQAEQEVDETLTIFASAVFVVPCFAPEPVVSIDVSCGQQAVAGVDATYAITVSGTGYLPVALVTIHFDFDMLSGDADVFEVVADEDGNFDTDIDPAHRPPGEYVIQAEQQVVEAPPISASAVFFVPCVDPDPVVEIDVECGPPQLVDDEGRFYAITVTGTGYVPGPLLLIFDVEAAPALQQTFAAEADEDGAFEILIEPRFMPEGDYVVVARQELVEAEALEMSVIFFVPCAPAEPEMTMDPTCGPVAVDQPAAYQINLVGIAFFPGPVGITFGPLSPNPELFTAFADEDGSFETTITPTGRGPDILDVVAHQEVEVSGTIAEATAIFVVDCDGPIMRVRPGSGPRGMVVRAEGFNFRSSEDATINLRWDRGIDRNRTFTVAVQPDGSWVRHILIFRKDFLGPRRLLPTLPGEEEPTFPDVFASYLVLQGTVQPPFDNENPFALPDQQLRRR